MKSYNTFRRQVKSFLKGTRPTTFHQSAISHASTPASIEQVVDPSPLIHQLPPEILTIILRLASLSRQEELCYDRARVISLSGVCSYWRDIMIKDGSLWTQIRFNGSEASHYLGLTWLARSYGHLIDVFVHIHNLTNTDVIYSHLDRVRTISIRGGDPDREGLYSILKTMQDNNSGLCSLTNFSIKFDYYNIDPDPPCLADRFGPPPAAVFNQLHTLRVVGAKFEPTLTSYSFSKLQTLELGRPCTMETLRAIVATTCNLRTIKLDCLELGVPLSIQEVTFPPSLQRLILSGIDTTTLSSLLGSSYSADYEIFLEICAHSVVSSTFGGTLESQTNRCVIELRDILQQTSNISTLTLTAYHLTGAHILTILSSLARTQALVLKSLHLDKGRLSAMARPHGTLGPSFPKFSNLELDNCRIDDPKAFQNLIESHPIKRVLVTRSYFLENGRYVEIHSASCFPVNLLKTVPDCQIQWVIDA